MEACFEAAYYGILVFIVVLSLAKVTLIQLL